MNILLVNTELYSDFWGGYNKDKLIKEVFLNKEFTVCPPIGLLYVAAYLKKHLKDISLRVIDLRLELVKYYLNGKSQNDTIYNFLQNVIKKNLYEFKPDVIGQSILFDVSSKLAEDVSAIIRNEDLGIKIVMGGFYPNIRFHYILKNNIADFVCIGEGELPLYNLAKSNFNPDIKIKGMVSKKQFLEGDFIAEPDLIMDLDQIPWPAYSLLAEEDMEYYITNQLFRANLSGHAERTGVLFSSRGCPRLCTFCAAHSVHGRKFRKRSADDVIAEMKYMTDKYGLDSIAFHDDTFTYDKKRTIDIFQQLLKEGLNVNIQFPNGVDVRTLDEEMILLFKKVKVNNLHIAVESGNQYMQDQVIKKRLNLKKVKETVDLLIKNNINTSCFFIIGFPGETKEMIDDSKEYAKNLGITWIAVNTPTPVYGSELHKVCLNQGLIREDYFKNKLYCDAYFSTSNFTAQEILEMAYDFNIEVNFLYNRQLRHGDLDRVFSRYLDISTRYPTHIINWICLYYCYKRMGNTVKKEETLGKIIQLYKECRFEVGRMEAWVTGNVKSMFDRYKKSIFDLCPEFKNIKDLNESEETNASEL